MLLPRAMSRRPEKGNKRARSADEWDSETEPQKRQERARLNIHESARRVLLPMMLRLDSLMAINSESLAYRCYTGWQQRLLVEEGQGLVRLLFLEELQSMPMIIHLSNLVEVHTTIGQ